MAAKKQAGRPPARVASRKLAVDTATESGHTAGSRQKRASTVSPTDSIASLAASHTRLRSPAVVITGSKRKHRDHDHDSGPDTNIRVIVRCRGRNEREIKENSAVVLATDGVKGDGLELSMGANALTNKTYRFDRVFSPAADQTMVYEDVVMPMLDDILSGLNCTVFAYGQTGTGKTYTMSGDMSDMSGLVSDSAGIIPRVLYSLFRKLEDDEREIAVKCSFIELYNEELRDLLAADENARLKIYEDGSKKAHGGTYVQGMEEAYIKRAADGLDLLQSGSHRRQVAATKCNDLSSRSHTVFTVTVYVKRVAENGEDYVSAGKLNLVDLAGSENIQRSGAENKRATEAGLINKSLLTLGRVINALVDKASHIPYRESKLTRLLQDSLGGHTRTCIIATVSPAKSNLEETISTLDYAFRAKNIRNKPQVNQLFAKKTLLREFTVEIEKLKSELVATRQRNGVYLTSESFEQLTGESESRRILNAEQKTKIELLETNLRNKVQDLFAMTTNFTSLKKEHETLKFQLDEASTLLDKTELVLAHTRSSLEEESALKCAHQRTEGELKDIGEGLISTLHKTVTDIGGLHSKLDREGAVSARNQGAWTASQAQVADITRVAQSKLREFESEQRRHAIVLSERLREVVHAEHQNLEQNETFLLKRQKEVEEHEAAMADSSNLARDNMENILFELKEVQKDVKARLSGGLQNLSAAANHVSHGVKKELESFEENLQQSYHSLDEHLRALFGQFSYHQEVQKAEVDGLRRSLSAATAAAAESQRASSWQIDQILVEERDQAAADRQHLLAQISALMNHSAEAQEARVAARVGALKAEIQASAQGLQAAETTCNERMDAWSAREADLAAEHAQLQEMSKSQLHDVHTETSRQCSSIQAAVDELHADMIEAANTQIGNIDARVETLADLAGEAQTANDEHYQAEADRRSNLVSSVAGNYQCVVERLTENSVQLQEVNLDLAKNAHSILDSFSMLEAGVHDPLEDLRAKTAAEEMEACAPTGQTPQRTAYQYPTRLPATDARDLRAAFRDGRKRRIPQSPKHSAKKRAHRRDFLVDTEYSRPQSQQGEVVMVDDDDVEGDRTMSTAASSSLREIAVNVSAGLLTTATSMPYKTNNNENNDIDVDIENSNSNDSIATAAATSTPSLAVAAAPTNGMTSSSSMLSRSTYGGKASSGVSSSMMPPPAKRRRNTMDTKLTPQPRRGQGSTPRPDGRENSVVSGYNLRRSRR